MTPWETESHMELEHHARFAEENRLAVWSMPSDSTSCGSFPRVPSSFETEQEAQIFFRTLTKEALQVSIQLGKK